MKVGSGFSLNRNRARGYAALVFTLLISSQLFATVVRAGNEPRRVVKRSGLSTVTARDATSENHAPIPAFTVEPASGVVGEEFAFDASGSSDPDGDPIRFAWNFGDGTTTDLDTSATATHAYQDGGSYLVKLTVRDSHNATVSITKTVPVVGRAENNPPIAIISTGPRDVALDDVVTFDGSLSFDPDGDPISYTWTFRFGGTVDEILTGAKVNKAFSQLGTYTVDLAVSDLFGAETDATTETVTVHERTSVEPPPPDTVPPPPEEPPDSALQRPGGTCGLGMLPAMFAMLAGLQLLRRNRPQ